MQILDAVKILDLPLLGVFVAYLKARWSDRSRVDQRRRRLRQLVSMVRAVADAADGAAAVRDGSLSAWLHVLRAEALRGQEVLDAAGCDASAVAGSARRFVAGLRALLVCSAEVDRLTEAVEELERLAGPGGDLATFVKVLRLEDARPRAAMDIDGRPGPGPASAARRRQEASGGAESVASGGGLPVPGSAKRKRPCGSAAGDASGGDVAERQKRRVLPWMRPHQWLPSGLGGLLLARPPPPVPASRPDRAREVALAMARVRRRIGRPTRRRRQPSLGQHLSRISLD